MKKSKKTYIDWIFAGCVVLLAAIVIIAAFGATRGVRRYRPLARECGEEFGIEPSLILAVMRVESGFDPNAESSKGACGLMQIKPSTFEFMKLQTGTMGEGDVFSPKANARMGTAYLKYLFSRFGDETTVLAAYNAGEGTVGGWLKTKEYSENGETLSKIPYRETAEYVKRVQVYKKLYSGK